jgi:hypothetical protein
MGWTPAERAARQKELDAAVWSTSWSEQRSAEVAAWEHTRVILANACAQARSAAGRMLRWAWGSAGAGAGVPALSELSLKKALGGSSIVMYNFGVGPRFAYVSASARAPK